MKCYKAAEKKQNMNLNNYSNIGVTSHTDASYDVKTSAT